MTLQLIRNLRFFGFAAVLTTAGLDTTAQPLLVVDRDVLRAAMVEELDEGYDPTATTNSARFFAEVIFSLAKTARTNDPRGRPLLIQQEDWFHIFHEVNGVPEENAGVGARLAFEHKQDVLIDYHAGNPIEITKAESVPDLVLNVQVGWQKNPDTPDRFSFEDTLSNPKLKVTNHRIIRFRLLQFEDMIMYDQIEGITGRPLTGLLAALFSVIGEGRIVSTRMAVTRDGVQVNRTRARKGLFSVTEIISIQPDGTAKKGLPDDSPESVALESKLKGEIELKYRDWNMPEYW